MKYFLWTESSSEVQDKVLQKSQKLLESEQQCSKVIEHRYESIHCLKTCPAPLGWIRQLKSWCWRNFVTTVSNPQQMRQSPKFTVQEKSPRTNLSHTILPCTPWSNVKWTIDHTQQISVRGFQFRIWKPVFGLSTRIQQKCYQMSYDERQDAQNLPKTKKSNLQIRAPNSDSETSHFGCGTNQYFQVYRHQGIIRVLKKPHTP